jgi:uncharacterized protein
LLFGVALLVVLVVLTLMYRSVSDVAIGFAGLLGTVVGRSGLSRCSAQVSRGGRVR